MSENTREPQYNVLLDLASRKGLTSLGLMSNYVWHEDPKRLTFVLARYKFVAKMLAGHQCVLEVGCADAFGTRIVAQEVDRVVAVDFDPIFVRDANDRMDPRWAFECFVHDILKAPVHGSYDAAYSIDVLEHIPQAEEETFVQNICKSLAKHGVLIIGTPSLESQAYASPISKAGHVNCKSYNDLKDLMARHFHNVFMFSMNDELVQTGFYQMAHYLFALCCSRR